MAGMAMSLRVVVPPHPLIAHWLTLLRDSSTPSPLFATALGELGRWLTYEAVRDWLPQRQVEVETGRGVSGGTVVDGSVGLLAIPLLPAGLGLWEGARTVLPAAALAPVLADWPVQDAATEPAAAGSITGLPTGIGERVGVLLFLPELATAQTCLRLLEQLAALGVGGERLRIIAGIASAPALASLGEAYPDLTIYCACIDPALDPEGRSVPGFGDTRSRFTGIDALTYLG
jgi:uracil phosphoribosyltransferase